MQDNNQIDALKAFKKAVEIEATHADANRNIGFIAIRFRDYVTAEKVFDTALKDASVKRDLEVYIAMGVAKRGLRSSKAEEWYRKALEMDKKDPRPWYNLAVLNQDHLIAKTASSRLRSRSTTTSPRSTAPSSTRSQRATRSTPLR